MAIKLVSYNGRLGIINHNGNLYTITGEDPVVVTRTITFSGSYGTWSNSSLTAYDGDYLSVSGKTVTCKIGGSSGATRWTNTFTVNQNTTSNLYKFNSISGSGSISGNKTVSASVSSFNTPVTYEVSGFFDKTSTSVDNLSSLLQNYGSNALSGATVSRMLLDTDVFVGFNVCQMTSDYLCGFVCDDSFDSPIAQDDVIIPFNGDSSYRAYWCCSASTNPEAAWSFVIMDSSTMKYLIVASNDSSVLYNDLYTHDGSTLTTLLENYILNNSNVLFAAELEFGDGWAELNVYKS